MQYVRNKAALLFLLVLGVFFVFSDTEASTLKIDGTFTSPPISAVDVQQIAIRENYQTFTTVEGFDVGSIKIKIFVSDLLGSDNFSVQIWNSSRTVLYGSSATTTISDTYPNGGDNPRPDTYAATEFVFDTPVTLNPATTYAFWVRGGTWTGFGGKVRTSGGSNTYSGGSCGNTGVSCSGDLWFEIYDAAPVDSINITFPISTSTPIVEFSDWEISYTTAIAESSSSPDFYSKQVYVGASTSTISTFAGGTAFFSTITPGEISISKPFGMLGGAGTWYAQAYLLYWEDIYDETPDIVATSTQISFVLNGYEVVGGAYSTPTSTATSSEWILTCDPDDPLIERSICNIGKFLFYPSSGILNNFQTLYNDIKNKPPFGYLVAVKNAIDGINYSATSTAGIADLSALDDNFFTPLKAGISIILWIVFVFWLFSRARHFQF